MMILIDLAWSLPLLL